MMVFLELLSVCPWYVKYFAREEWSKEKDIVIDGQGVESWGWCLYAAREEGMPFNLLTKGKSPCFPRLSFEISNAGELQRKQLSPSDNL